MALPKTLSLNHAWQFRPKKGNASWKSAQVPGDVFLDLLVHDQIEDPYWRLNEAKLYWLEEAEWEYQLFFDVPWDLDQHSATVLQFAGLDTYARVYLNGVLILDCDNMFRAWQLDVKSQLREGQNHLLICFDSAVKRGMERLARTPYLVPAHNEQTFLHQRTSVHSRKTPYHYGWDWGPRLLGAGIWRQVNLTAWSKARIEDLNWSLLDFSPGRVGYEAKVEVEIADAGEYLLELALNAEKIHQMEVLCEKGMNTFVLPFEIISPRLWWPNGSGEAYLYSLEVRLKKEEDVLDREEKRLGVRQIRLIQKPDSEGRSFYFEVNGEPIYSKGANYIPPDFFSSRLGEEQYQLVIAGAVEANMNMLRVWGGAVYEDDRFYELCDENGLMVWQDFMFACALYPGNKDFLASVKEEIVYNVRRLRHHACLALWCGNNENLNGWHQWDWPKTYLLQVEDERDLWEAYHSLFHQLLPTCLKELDPERPYWPTSPAAGYNILSNPGAGDEHDWRVWFESVDFETYQTGVARFVSEYGFQSLPALATMSRFSEPQDWSLKLRSPVLSHRQRSRIGTLGPEADGNQQILNYLRRYYPEPVNFESLIYLSQMNQALAMKYAIEGHRAQKPRNMGSMYWQLDDCWPTISWSTIDYYGNWKAAHYQVRRSYEETIVVFIEKENQLSLHLISDCREAQSLELKICLLSFYGSVVISEEQLVHLKPQENRRYKDWFIPDLLEDRQKNQHVLLAELYQQGSKMARNTHYFVRPKDLDLPICDLEMESIQHGWSLHSPVLIKNLWLNKGTTSLEGRFSDNAFDLMPGEKREIISLSSEIEETEKISYQCLNPERTPEE